MQNGAEIPIQTTARIAVGQWESHQINGDTRFEAERA